MEIKVVKLSKEQSRKALPARVYGLIEQSDCRIFVALEENVMMGIAVVTMSDKSRGDYVINHIALVGSDEIIVIEELLKYIENACRNFGAENMVCRMTGDMEYLSIMNDVFLKNDYSLDYAKGHHMIYHMGTIKNTLFFSKLEQLKPIMKNVKCYNELDILLLSQFNKKMKNTRININNYSPDLVFAQYYVKDDDIKGFMDFKEVDEGVLLLTDSYVESDIKDKYVAPAMIASAINVTNSFLPDDAELILQTYTEGMFAGLEACFGKPEIDELIYEYSKEL